VSVSTGPSLLPLQAGEHYRFVFDATVCIGCHSCEVACAEQNDLPVEVSWRRVGEVEGGSHPTTSRFHLSIACNHCVEPACLQGCPTGAYEKLWNGIVEHHADDCIGCAYCTWNCPYSVPVMDPVRKIATKCDMCSPRIDAGLAPACVNACPTHAIGIEAVNVAEWVADHSAGDAPHLPSASITISTTRIVLPDNVPATTFAANDHHVALEHPHWPLIVVTLFTQAAVGASLASVIDGATRPGLVAAAALAVAGSTASLAHLGRPTMAWKVYRGLRTSWLSREAIGFVLLCGAALVGAAFPSTGAAITTAVIGALALFASARLYMVPGRPSWHTPLTIAAFAASTGVGVMWFSPNVGRVLAAISVTTWVVNLVRLRRGSHVAEHGTWTLTTTHVRPWAIARIITALVAIAAPLPFALVALAVSELVGRWLFYVTVVPLDMPGAFFRARR
jgi:formate dehydrogenase iron-sulfur subunit